MGKKLNLQVLLKLNPDANKEENKKEILSNFHLTPIKAIRERCKDCSGNSMKEIRNCNMAEVAVTRAVYSGSISLNRV